MTQVSNDSDSVVATYSGHSDAENAINLLKNNDSTLNSWLF